MPDAAPVPQSAARAWWFVALLCFAAFLSVIDRGIVNLIVDPLRHELALSDVQVGLLQGLAFGLIYSVGGVFLGVAADRRSRRNLVIVGIAVWSAATLAAGLARSFGELFAARVLVGLGEAALSPAAISLIADLFPPGRRGRPTGLFMAGQAISNGLAILVTGQLLALAAEQRFALLGLPAAMSPWRQTFVLCGLGGIVVVLAFFTCREPPRAQSSRADSLWLHSRETLAHFARRWRAFLPLYAGFACCFAAAYASAAWSPTLLIRVFGLTPAQLAKTLAPTTIAFAVAGPLIGSFVFDPLARRFGERGRLLLVATAVLAALPSGFATWAGTPAAAVLLVASSSAIYPLVGLGVLTSLQMQLPPHMHGFGIAMTGLVNTAIGAVSGPLLVAWLTEHVFHDPSQVGRSIALVVAPAVLLASLLFAIATRAIGAAAPAAAPGVAAAGVGRH